MAISDFDIHKKKLEQERMRIEQQLSRIAERNPENPDDWRIKTAEGRPDSADVSELADKFEEMGTQASIGEALKARLSNVIKAIKRIDEGTYGKCEVGNEDIDPKRLDANPAASTCMEHADQS